MGTPSNDEDVKARRGRAEGLDVGREPRGIQKHIADEDKKSRTGSTEEEVRNTPPAGPWNDISGD
ncbi:MAG TPA: hypothetical protein VIL32_06300 [Steroidobacteraceae bacterium]